MRQIILKRNSSYGNSKVNVRQMRTRTTRTLHHLLKYNNGTLPQRCRYLRITLPASPPPPYLANKEPIQHRLDWDLSQTHTLTTTGLLVTTLPNLCRLYLLRTNTTDLSVSEESSRIMQSSYSSACFLCLSSTSSEGCGIYTHGFLKNSTGFF